MIYDDDGFLNKTISLNFFIYLFLIFSGREIVVSVVIYFVSFLPSTMQSSFVFFFFSYIRQFPHFTNNID